jgi:hypothetical protein
VSVNTGKSDEPFGILSLVLPGVYVGTILLTTVLSIGTPGGAYYRVFGVCPLVASIGMVYDSTSVIVGAFLVVGTPWWYLVGRIGLSGYRRARGPLSAAVGVAIAGFTCFVTGSMTSGVFKQDIRDSAVKGWVIAQYWLVALLCFGALVSGVFSLVAAVTPARES